ncbi:MAG TPA: polysaccharide biosynthesis tyrosine autokinase [Sphingomicrobium sp.]|nr:polysaccharide biosynthesis tyrosine autokinase [Sphingomicrobium sp.]
MNNNLPVAKDEGTWVVDRYGPGNRLHPDEPGRTAPSVLDLAALVRIITHWRWLILSAVILGIAAAVIITLLTTPMYRAKVTLEVNPPSVEILDENTRDRGIAQSNWDFVATQVGLLASRSVAERAAQDLNLANNPEFVGTGGDPSTRLNIAASRVAGGLRVRAPDQGQLIEFTYESESPQLAAQVANAIAEAFINSNLQRRYEASAYARTFLERQIAKTRGDLERSERQLVSYAQAQGIINTASGDSGAPGSDANSLQGQSLVALNDALATATARRVAAEGAYRAASAAGATTEVTEGSQHLRQARAALEAEYQEKRTMMKPEHPEMLSLRSRIDELGRQISRETSQVTSARVNSLAAEYRAAVAAERALQGRVAALKGSVLDLRGRSIQYTILQRDVDTNRALYDALLQRYKEVGVAGGIGAAPISIVDRAEPPGGPFKPNLPLNLAFGLGLGLIGGVGAAVGLEFVNDTIKSRDDVRNKLGLACLGAVPKTVGKTSFVDDLRDPGSMVSEAYSAVVAALRFSTDSGVPKALLVTSARPSEGKSSSALALAQNFSRRGKKVLLIDGDLRKPTFKTASEKTGLTQLLTNEDSVGNHIVQTQYENLWLLPCGPLPPNPADLLSTNRFQHVLREASSHFDLVIIDAPPTLGLADAPLLSAVTGNVMFVIEAGKTRTSAAREAIERIESSGAHIIGATLTKATESGGYGYKNYGYGYGYGYGKVGTKQNEIQMIPQGSDS